MWPSQGWTPGVGSSSCLLHRHWAGMSWGETRTMPGAGFSAPYQFSGVDHALVLWAAVFFPFLLEFTLNDIEKETYTLKTFENYGSLT